MCASSNQPAPRQRDTRPCTSLPWRRTADSIPMQPRSQRHDLVAFERQADGRQDTIGKNRVRFGINSTLRTVSIRPTTAPRYPCSASDCPPLHRPHGSPFPPEDWRRLHSRCCMASRAQCRAVTNSLRRVSHGRGDESLFFRVRRQIRRVVVHFDCDQIGDLGQNGAHQHSFASAAQPLPEFFRLLAHLLGDHEMPSEFIGVAGRVVRVRQN